MEPSVMHLDLTTIATIGTLLVQTATISWWASRTATRVDRLEEDLKVHLGDAKMIEKQIGVTETRLAEILVELRHLRKAVIGNG